MVPPDSHEVSRILRGTQEHNGSPQRFAYGAFTLYGGPFQGTFGYAVDFLLPVTPGGASAVSYDTRTTEDSSPLGPPGLGCFPFARHYSGNTFSFPRGIKMFQFPRLPLPNL